jgi:hypothetical protein
LRRLGLRGLRLAYWRQIDGSLSTNVGDGEKRNEQSKADWGDSRGHAPL